MITYNDKLHIITPLCYTSDHRVEYFKKYIDHVNQLDNLSNIKFLFFVEPNSENMINMIPKHWDKIIFQNYYNFKPALNHFIAFNYCFDHLNLDFCFLLEDDIICSPDLYNLSMYCIKNNLLNNSLLCTFNKHRLMMPNHRLYQHEDESSLVKLVGSGYISCWGTGVSKSFWENCLYKSWKMHITFDATIDRYFNTCDVVFPVVSRTNQIGKVGLNYNPELWDLHGFKNVTISKKNVNTYKVIDYANYS